MKLDDSDNSAGWKYAEYEMKGVPVRIELGPRDIEAGQCVLALRHNGEKRTVPLETVSASLAQALEDVRSGMYAAALANREAPTTARRSGKSFQRSKPGATASSARRGAATRPARTKSRKRPASVRAASPSARRLRRAAAASAAGRKPSTSFTGARRIKSGTKKAVRAEAEGLFSAAAKAEKRLSTYEHAIKLQGEKPSHKKLCSGYAWQKPSQSRLCSFFVQFCIAFRDKQCPYVQRRQSRRWTYGGERSRNGGFPVVSFRVLCRPPVLRGPEFRFHFNEHHRKTAEKRGSFRFCRARSVRAAGGGDRNRGNKRGFPYIKKPCYLYEIP